MMNDYSQIIISEDEVIELSHWVKLEIKNFKMRIILGVFNGKIPVLLNVPGNLQLTEVFSVRNINLNARYKILFDKPDEEWKIVSDEEGIEIFTFHIPYELKKILAKRTDPEKYLNLKKEFMSSLTFTLKDEGIVRTYRLELNSNWINKIIQENLRLSTD